MTGDTTPSAETRSLYPERTVVVCALPARRAEAARLADQLGLECHGTRADNANGLALVLTPERLQLEATGPRAPGAVCADFVTGATARRGRNAARADEGLLRAAGARHGRTPDIIDATAGLGGDAWLLAAVGCTVTLIERHPVVRALLADGLARARQDPDAAAIAARMTLIEGEAMDLLASRTTDSVVLDPMHPPRYKSAAVRKEMQLLQALVGPDDDSARLLPPAIAAARQRVAVKRPRGAAPLADMTPSGTIAGRSTRFDIYAGTAARA